MDQLTADWLVLARRNNYRRNYYATLGPVHSGFDLRTEDAQSFARGCLAKITPFVRVQIEAQGEVTQ
jgi:hypothetical protein